MSSTISSATPSSATSSASAGGGLVTSTGIGSGLDISAIVSSLTDAFGAGPQGEITKQETALDSQVSAFGSFTSALDTLQGTLSALENPTQLAGFDATVGDATVASASASTGAVAGQYSLSVQNLATAATLTSSPVAASTSTIGTGTLTISVGGTSDAINIDSSNNTLAGIAAAINESTSNPGISASIITSSDGARLVLSGTSTGAANAITVTQSGGDGGLASLVYDPADHVTNLTQTQAAADANFTINGYPATSSTNVASGAISGVTLDLLQPSAAGASTTLTVSPDTTGAATSIGTFVTALNGVLSSIQTLTGYDASTQTPGALEGNATLQAFQSQLENILDTVTSSKSGVASLADIGLTADANTGSVDSAATPLSNALSSNLAAVGQLLGGPNGIATRINALVTQYTQAGGLLATINQGLQSGLTNLSTQQTALNSELATYSATLTAQYNAMDKAVASLKETQNYLTAAFNPGSSSNGSSTSSLSSGITTS